MVIVDAYNVIRTEGVLPSHLAGGDLASLIRMIGASRYRRDSVLLACDGTGTGRPAPSIRLPPRHDAGPDREADSVFLASRR
ncbi:MAG: hypothetical protein KDA28_00645, partial [Phycisphaerales bacterium]|nr:hypothetical protein [Phycisphaerales bacterium]